MIAKDVTLGFHFFHKTMSVESTIIRTALLSVYYKDGLEPLVRKLHEQGVKLLSTGGTQAFIEGLGIPVQAVEDVTHYPSIFGGRVKTLHPAIFGGILQRRNLDSDKAEALQHNIPPIDLVIVDLYPFQETVAAGGSEADIIEKIDIGGISLIRAAAKNFQDVVIISSRSQYASLLDMITAQEGKTTLAQRRLFATEAFHQSSDYDTAIFQYFNQEEKLPVFKSSIGTGRSLRYGENPHQKGAFYGNLEEVLEQLHGKELSYNNLVDVDAAIALIAEFDVSEGATCAIIKHTNACGVATRATAALAYEAALACDPVSAFGGVIVLNDKVDVDTAKLLHSLFFEVLVAPDYDVEALEILFAKKNRVILKQKQAIEAKSQFKTLLNGVLEMDKDVAMETKADLKIVTKVTPTDKEIDSLLFAAKICKHTKSNTIVFSNKKTLIASGTGQTSRVDALNQAIEKAKHFGFSLEGAAMASDAFFPFPDCVEIAFQAGVRAVIQPGGSIKDLESIQYCDSSGMAMVFTGLRHFKH